jgi:hypothetical protein
MVGFGATSPLAGAPVMDRIPPHQAVHSGRTERRVCAGLQPLA